jgi:LEA14-like dessication related protein
MRKLCLILCVILAPPGCATPDKGRPPSIDLADLGLGSTGLRGQELKLGIRIGNHNDFAIPLTGLSFKLEVNGRPFAEGLSNKPVTVPRLAYADMQVTGTTNRLSLVRQLMTVGDSDRIDYRLFGTAHVGRLGQNGTMAFDRKGSLSLLPAPPGQRQRPSAVRVFAPSPL